MGGTDARYLYDKRLQGGATPTYRLELDEYVYVSQGGEMVPVVTVGETEEDRVHLGPCDRIWHTAGNFIIVRKAGTEEYWEIGRDHFARPISEEGRESLRRYFEPRKGPDIIQPSPLYQAAMRLILRERTAQQAKWGEQRHGMAIWNLVLTEEVGEAAQALLKLRSLPLPEETPDPTLAPDARTMARYDAIRALETEVIQVAAVAVAWLEHLIEVRSRTDILPGEVWED